MVKNNCGSAAGTKRRFPLFTFLAQETIDGVAVEYAGCVTLGICGCKVIALIQIKAKQSLSFVKQNVIAQLSSLRPCLYFLPQLCVYLVCIFNRHAVYGFLRQKCKQWKTTART